MLCPECGHPLVKGAAFCGQCGHRLPQPAPPQPAPKPQRNRWLIGLIGILLIFICLGILLFLSFGPLRPQITALFMTPTTLPTLPVDSVEATKEHEPIEITSTPTLTPTVQIEVINNVSPTAIPTKTSTPIPPTPTATISPTPSLQVATITLSANQPRYETGIFIQSGQSVTITYVRGNWRTGPQAVWPFVGPNGDPQVAQKETFPVRTRPIMSLIGGINASPVFFVGEFIQFISQEQGELWFGSNDDAHQDNEGELVLEIQVTDESNSITQATPAAAADITAFHTSSPPTLDGSLVEWYGVPTYLSPHLVYQDDNWDGTQDLTIFWQWQWDDENLYLGAKIIDNIHVQTESGNQVFLGDSLELQIDTGSRGKTESDPDVYQLLLSPGNFNNVPPSAYRFQGTNNGNITNAPGSTIRVTAQHIPTGYTLEAIIPWSDLGFQPQSGLVLGFACSATDNDTPGTARQEIMISNVSSRVWNNPSTWGTLTIQP